MRVLVIGSGGREHALCWAIAASPLLTKLWCAPGNPGIAQVAECVSIDALDFPALIAFAQDNEIDLVVPGPEAPLVVGIADAMEAAGIACIGPSRSAAQLEGSKTFTKELCDAAGIPTAQWESFDDADAAREFVRRRGAPIVVKADGLAAGKGVVVATNEADALAAIDAMMQARRFGDAGSSVVIEEYLTGEEVSLFALCDGETALALGSAQDHKRVGDGDTGPNTGGMGSYAPTPAFSAGTAGRGDGRHHPPRSRRDDAARYAVPRHPVRRSDADRRWREADRIQRAVRRPGMSGAGAAPEVRPAVGAAGRVRRRIEELRSALER